MLHYTFDKDIKGQCYDDADPDIEVLRLRAQRHPGFRVGAHSTKYSNLYGIVALTWLQRSTRRSWNRNSTSMESMPEQCEVKTPTVKVLFVNPTLKLGWRFMDIVSVHY